MSVVSRKLACFPSFVELRAPECDAAGVSGGGHLVAGVAAPPLSPLDEGGGAEGRAPGRVPPRAHARPLGRALVAAAARLVAHGVGAAAPHASVCERTHILVEIHLQVKDSYLFFSKMRYRHHRAALSEYCHRVMHVLSRTIKKTSDKGKQELSVT